MRPIRLHYPIRIPNLGHRVNLPLVEKISGLAVRYTGVTTEPHLLAIGSLMAAATPASLVWGTGVMHPSAGIGRAQAANIHALRGVRSCKALREGGIPVGDVPLGDPAYLLPRHFGIRRNVFPEHPIGVVTDHLDQPNVVRALPQGPGVFALDVQDEPESFLRKMANCATVISTSLYPLILAEALEIPNMWIKASEEVTTRDFEFHDWFSTTRRPQVLPHIPTSGESVEDLAKRSALHESVIDTQALLMAFPFRRLDEIRSSATHSFVPYNVCRKSNMPVFLISFNRGEMLKKTISSIKRQRRRTEIIIHDNGSTDIETIAFLAELEQQGIRVYRGSAIMTADELNNVDSTVQDYFAEWAEPTRYVVSDCDVDMSVADPRALDVYDELLNYIEAANCAGPMLRIRDIPAGYPMYARVMNRHIEQFWQKVPTIGQTSRGPVAYLECVIDTTLSVHRAGEPFRRLKRGLRVYEPYEALHLDWYLLEGCDTTYTNTSSPGISHWNNKEERARYSGVSVEYSDFYAVRVMPTGELEIYTERLPANGRITN